MIDKGKNKLLGIGAIGIFHFYSFFIKTSLPSGQR